MKQEALPIIIAGTGGASKETYYLIKKINSFNEEHFSVLGFLEKDSNRIEEIIFDNQKIIASDDTLDEVISRYDNIGIVIPFSDPKPKKQLFQLFGKHNNVVFPNIIHPSAIFEGELQMGMGNIISAGVVLACDLKLGNFNLINRCCTTGHDVKLGDFNTLNPASVISGNVTIGDQCMVGAGSVVLQGLRIEDGAIIGAGAVLTVNAEHGSIMVGVPARRKK